MIYRKSFSTALGAILVVGMMGLGVNVSNASPAPSPNTGVSKFSAIELADLSSASLSPETIAQGIEELKSALPNTEVVDSNGTKTTFTLPNGSEMTLVSPTTPEVQPRLGGGSDNHGPYISLNPFDQDAVIAGGGWALGLAICAIPVVGVAGCAVTGATLAAAGLYLSYNAKCNGELRVPIWPGSQPHCA